MINVHWYHPSKRLTVIITLSMVVAILAASAYAGGAYLVSQGDQTEEGIRIKRYTMPASILDVDEKAPWWKRAWMVGDILRRDGRIYELVKTVKEGQSSCVRIPEWIEVNTTEGLIVKLRYVVPGHQEYYTPGAGHYDIVVNVDEEKVLSILKTSVDAPLTWP